MGASTTHLFLAAARAGVKQRGLLRTRIAGSPICPGPLLTVGCAAAILRVCFIGATRHKNQDRALTPMVRKKLGRGRKNRCRFCTKEGCPRPAFVDYKDVQGLKKLCTSQGKLYSRKRSGNCAAFQRAVKDAVKRARFMALLPYVGE